MSATTTTTMLTRDSHSQLNSTHAQCIAKQRLGWPTALPPHRVLLLFFGIRTTPIPPFLATNHPSTAPLQARRVPHKPLKWQPVILPRSDPSRTLASLPLLSSPKSHRFSSPTPSKLLPSTTSAFLQPQAQWPTLSSMSPGPIPPATVCFLLHLEPPPLPRHIDIYIAIAI